MYEVYKEESFSGAHHLRNYHGKCESLHGHNWKVRAFISSSTLDEAGMVIDFKILKKYMNETAEKLDHTDLNTIPPFDSINPSAENLAKYFFDELSAKINDARIKVSRVLVWESEGSCAGYSPD